jgi:hypothetical protein
MPAQHDLRWASTVALGDLRDRWSSEQIRTGSTERTPRHGHDAFVSVVGAGDGASDIRVDLNLVHIRQLTSLGQQPIQVRRLEVGRANRTHPALFNNFKSPRHAST